jgi:hypothetical protein
MFGLVPPLRSRLPSAAPPKKRAREEGDGGEYKDGPGTSNSKGPSAAFRAFSDAVASKVWPTRRSYALHHITREETRKSDRSVG